MSAHFSEQAAGYSFVPNRAATHRQLSTAGWFTASMQDSKSGFTTAERGLSSGHDLLRSQHPAVKPVEATEANLLVGMMGEGKTLQATIFGPLAIPDSSARNGEACVESGQHCEEDASP